MNIHTLLENFCNYGLTPCPQQKERIPLTAFNRERQITRKATGKKTKMVKGKQLCENWLMDFFMCQALMQKVLKPECHKVMLWTADGGEYSLVPKSVRVRYMYEDEMGQFALVDASVASPGNPSVAMFVRSMEIHAVDLNKEEVDSNVRIRGGMLCASEGRMARVEINVTRNERGERCLGDTLIFYYP